MFSAAYPVLILYSGKRSSYSFRTAAAYVRQEATSVSITSKKTGWRKIHGAYYFYNSKGRMICGSFKYKGHYYYCTANG